MASKAKKLYQLKRELITDSIRLLLPSIVSAKKPLKFWLDNKIAKESELDEVSESG